MSSSQHLTAFVIMPFDRKFDEVFESLIPDALPSYKVIRGDSDLNQVNVLQKIAHGIRGADLVIADVTDANANVMYELGAAHAMDRPTVMMSQRLDNLPFDLRSYPVLAYETAGDRAAVFTRRLREIGERHAAGELRFANPFRDFPGVVPPAPAPVPSESRAAAIPSIGDYEFLDYEADMEEYGKQVIAQFQRLGAANAQLTAGVQALSAPTQRLRPGHSAKHERQLLNDMAALMRDYSRVVENEILPPFREGWGHIGRAMHWMASQKPTDMTSEQIEELCATGRGLREALRGILENVSGLLDIVSSGRGRTGALNSAVESMKQALNSTVSEVLLADAMLASVHTRLGCPGLWSG